MATAFALDSLHHVPALSPNSGPSVHLSKAVVTAHTHPDARATISWSILSDIPVSVVTSTIDFPSAIGGYHTTAEHGSPPSIRGFEGLPKHLSHHPSTL